VRAYCSEPERGRRNGKTERKKSQRFIRTGNGFGASATEADPMAGRMWNPALRIRTRSAACGARPATREHRQETADSCGRIQSRTDLEKDKRRRDATRVLGTSTGAYFSSLASLRRLKIAVPCMFRALHQYASIARNANSNSRSSPSSRLSKIGKSVQTRAARRGSGSFT
jgi:hypothetical protein